MNLVHGTNSTSRALGKLGVISVPAAGLVLGGDC